MLVQILARWFWPQTLARKNVARKCWPANIDLQILARKYWPANVGPQMLARKYWQILARKKCGPQILARKNVARKCWPAKMWPANFGPQMLARKCWPTNIDPQILARSPHSSHSPGFSAQQVWENMFGIMQRSFQWHGLNPTAATKCHDLCVRPMLKFHSQPISKLTEVYQCQFLDLPSWELNQTGVKRQAH